MMKIELSEKIKQSRLLITQVIEKPMDILTIEENDQKSILCTLGNISLIQGQAKSRKTFLISYIVVALLQGAEFLKFTGKLPNNKSTILYFDTEQGLHHCKKVQERIYNLAGLSVKEENINFRYYHLRPFNHNERLEIIEKEIKETKNLGFVIIDGVRDLVSDINDAKEATTVIGLLMKWSDLYQIHVLSVLHENKGDRNSRGHLGSELQNKAESVIRVSRDQANKNYSKVEPVYLREIDFTDFSFEVDTTTQRPLIVSGVSKKTYRFPNEVDELLHKNWIKEVFKSGTDFSQTKYVKGLKDTAIQYGLWIGDNKLRDFVNYQIEQGWIKNIGEGQCMKLQLNI